MLQYFMAKIDKIKEFIGFLKAIFITAIVIMSSLIAYLYKEQSLQENILVVFALILDFIFIILLLKKILKEINELEKL